MVTGEANLVAVPAFPEISPTTLEPIIESIFESVIALSATLAVVIALLAINGELAVPLKSPANIMVPLVIESAEGIIKFAVTEST